MNAKLLLGSRGEHFAVAKLELRKQCVPKLELGNELIVDRRPRRADAAPLARIGTT